MIIKYMNWPAGPLPDALDITFCFLYYSPTEMCQYLKKYEGKCLYSHFAFHISYCFVINFS